MNKNKENRRKLIKSLATGTGAVAATSSLPESWSKPVIQSLVLPAHATTTADTGALGADTPAASTTLQATTTADPRCYIPAGCHNFYGFYISLPTAYEGDFFASYTIQLYENGCSQLFGTNKINTPLVVARTREDAAAFFADNSQPVDEIVELKISSGGCILWEGKLPK